MRSFSTFGPNSRWAARAALFALLAVGCGSSSNPTAPTSTQTPSPTSTVSAITTRIVNALNSSQGIGAIVDVAGGGSFTAAPVVIVELTVPNIGQYRLTIRAAGFVDRQTGIRAGATSTQQPIQISLIPTSFDLRAFDEGYRNGNGIGNALLKWARNPVLRLNQTVYDFNQGNGPRALNDQISAANLDCVSGYMRQALQEMTGGVLQFSSVEILPVVPPGTPLASGPQDNGSILFTGMRNLSAFALGSSVWNSNTGEINYGFVHMPVDRNAAACGTRLDATYAHEVGHALGLQHVQSRASVMNATAVPITQFDRDAIAILNQRPPRNRTSDVDPETFAVGVTTSSNPTSHRLFEWGRSF